MWSAALDAIFTTLRYLAPATLLTLFWGQQSFLFKLLKHIDLAIRTVVFSSNEQKDSVLQWLAESGPVRVEGLDTVWRHGWILCGVLDSALPGTCAGHPPTRLSLKHAQTIAEHYLAVESVFSDYELESNDCLSKRQEWKLAHYLDRIRQAMAKIPPAVSKPCSQRTSPESIPFNFDYAAKGSGLSSAQVNNTMYFKIYPTTQQSLTPGDIKIQIKGPNNVEGMIVIPPILGKAQLIRKRILEVDRNKNYTESVLPITQGATYLRNYGKTDINKTYYIPRSKYDIDLTVDCKQDYAKIGYTVIVEGKYEITISSNGQNILGSPFNMTASNNILKNLEQESFCLEDGEEIDIVDITTDKKVVLRIVDFVTEKMLLREDGVLERISDEAAEILMTTKTKACKVNDVTRSYLSSRFKDAAIKIVLMIRICKILKDNAKSRLLNKQDVLLCSQHDVPDLVNFTRQENNNIGLSKFKNNKSNIKSGKDTNNTKEAPIAAAPKIKIITDSEDILDENSSQVSLELELITEKCFEENDIKPELIERPKTPVLKIITGNLDDRCDSVYLDEQTEIYEKLLAANEFLNPFFMHQLNKKEKNNGNVTDFIIGAPVSVAKSVHSSISQNAMDSILIPNTETEESSEPEDSLEYKNSHNTIELKENNPFYDFENTLNTSVKKVEDTTQNQEKKSQNKRDIWDSAYVSIDENSSSPNSNSQSPIKLEQDLAYDKWNKEVENMGPAEKELWESCNDLLPQQNLQDEIRQPRWSLRKNTFTPILEESDRSLSLSLKYETNDDNENNGLSSKTDAVTEAFAELDEVFETYSYSPIEKKNKVHSKDSKINKVKSASEKSSDVMRLIDITQEGISEVQSNVTESVSVSQNLHTLANHLNKNTQSNIVLEKKKFWDEKIRVIEEIKVEQQKKEKKIHSKQMKNNDSLSKRKGKQMLKNFLAASEKAQTNETFTKLDSTPKREEPGFSCKIEDKAEAKLVDKWKKFWDEKLETESTEQLFTCTKDDSLTLRESPRLVTPNQKDVHLPKHQYLKDLESTQDSISSYESEMEISKALRRIRSTSSSNSTIELENKTHHDTKNETTNTNQYINSKELESKSVPEDIMFKAFETSPKRFFGTSRRQIMSKIDAYLGNTDSNDNDKDIITSSKEKGIVTSKISMLRNISNDGMLLKHKSPEKINDQEVLDSLKNESFVSKFKTNFNQQKDNLETVDSKKKLVTAKRCSNNQKEPIQTKSFESKDETQRNTSDKNTSISLKERRNAFKSQSMTNSLSSFEDKPKFIQNRPPQKIQVIKPEYSPQSRPLRKSAFSKSEINLNKTFATFNKERNSEKYKSCDELPKTNVKNFIGLYETVSKSVNQKPMIIKKRTVSITESSPHIERTEGNDQIDMEKDINSCKVESIIAALNKKQIEATPSAPPRRKKSNTPSKDNLNKSLSVDSLEDNTQVYSQHQECEDEPAYISISDIDIEIIEKNDETTNETKPHRNVPIHDFSSRFKTAKQYFQSLEELRDEKKLMKTDNLVTATKKESLQTETPKRCIKTRSWSSTELSRICDEEPNDSSKLMKISEKFHVDDFYNDVVEGKLSRQGSLRGIPNKRAVLETFKSMENVSHGVMSPYELAVTQLNDFAKENSVRNAQTYLTEYPYLPTTDPSKYHSRIDTKASGLISMREINNQKQRRNSVPDRNNEFDKPVIF